MTTPQFEYPEVRDWRDLADCLGIDLAVFFQERDAPGPRTYKEARKICGMCRVKSECLETAMRDERGVSQVYRHGVYGGLTPGERVKLSKERGEYRARDYGLEDVA